MNSVAGFKIISSTATNLTNANPDLFFPYTSCAAESTRPSQTAYDLLGVSETSSFAEIKASFRKLAKQTHPDLADSRTDPDSSRRFVQILAAYEILSDSEKRSHYDMYLLSQRKVLSARKSGHGVSFRVYDSHVSSFKQMEAAEWLKWYRSAVKEILSEKRSAVVGNGYFDELEMDFYSAVRQAYYGPEIGSVDFLPDCFEAEDRSVLETPEVLHLVSGRDLFGTVSLANESPKSSAPLLSGSGTGRSDEDSNLALSSDDRGRSRDAYADLELRVCGRAVAVATRVGGVETDGGEDRVHVFLCSTEGSLVDVDNAGTRIPLGTVTGLGTSSEEGSCFVYNSSGTKTHVVMKHRTLLVKHMYWYELGDEVSVCECRCSRARLPPSKFWLFEPRCGAHDAGGWYVETFGRDKKGRTVLSQRYWDGFDPSEKFEKRLHPAMYLLALAYRSLDLEDARIRKYSVVQHVQRKVSTVLSWCKKLI